MTEAIPEQALFMTPDVYSEYGEFDRVGKEFGFDGATLMYLARENGKIIALTDEAWSELENTPSYEIEEGDWETVAYHAKAHSRDYIDLRKKLTGGISVDAPIVIKVADTLHLVSGNTRLMVVKACGIKPQVYLFEVDTHEV
jgi:hypothetical protein